MSDSRAIPETTIARTAVPSGLFIAGQWQLARDEKQFAVHDPCTGAIVAHVADATLVDAAAALDSAHEAQTSWGRTTPRARADILLRAFALIQSHRDTIAAIISAEIGRPLQESVGEVHYGNEFFRWFAEQAAHLDGGFRLSPSGNTQIMTTHMPVGPALLITPWNFPLAMGTRKIGAALAAGCTMIVKPAAQTPLTMAFLVQLLEQAGVPPGVLNLLPTARDAEMSQALMSDSRLRKVSFTGSTRAGVQLLKQAAPNVMRSSMELGGNGPFLVLEDADVAAAVEGAMLAKFRNGGQSCVAANRFLVHREVVDAFTEKLVERTCRLKVAGSETPDGDIGPLIDQKQRDRLEKMVDEAVEKGATVLTGGKKIAGGGYFFEPTVLTHVPTDAAIGSEEIFGPVAVIKVVESDDEAVKLANETPFGLAAFVYTTNLDRAFDVTSRIEAGMIGLNRGLVSEPAAPFGGVKASGLGREGGHTGIEEYLETKYIALDRSAID